MNFSRKIIFVLIALNQDIQKQIVKIILDVITVKEITTQLFVIKGKIEIVTTIESSANSQCHCSTDNYENKILTVKTLLDSGSQQLFISTKLMKELNLKLIREVPVDIITFMNNHKRTTEFKQYEIIV